jgi:hypothetical protein
LDDDGLCVADPGETECQVEPSEVRARAFVGFLQLRRAGRRRAVPDATPLSPDAPVAAAKMLAPNTVETASFLIDRIRFEGLPEADVNSSFMHDA